MKLDTEALEQFNILITKLVSDMEETWYIIKYLLSEMDAEILYTNNNVDLELRTIYHKMEKLLERFEKLKLIMQNVPYEYQEMMNRHLQQMQLMSEYARGLKHTYLSLSNEYHKERISVVHTNTAPIKNAIEEIYNIKKVLKDE